jgi:hypothetical protein
MPQLLPRFIAAGKPFPAMPANTSTPALPPRAGMLDLALMFGCVLVIGLVIHIVRGLPAFLRKEAELSAGKNHNRVITDDQLSAIRRFHWSAEAFILSLIPFLLAAAANTAVSLIRDTGYMIFPWPVLASSALIGLGFGITLYRRALKIRKIVLPEE